MNVLSTTKRGGFTLVEIIVAISVIAILATLVTIGFSRVQTEARDGQRNASAVSLREALEQYYDKNGEYPSCSMLTESSASVTQALGVNLDVIKAPNGTTDNSISCSDITDATSDDIFAYVGDGSANCSSGNSCLQYTLKYKKEASGDIVAFDSRRKVGITTSGGTTLTATPNGQTAVDLSWTPIQNALSYTIQRSVSNSFPAGSGTVTTSSTGTTVAQTSLRPGTTYYFKLQATASTGTGSWTDVVTADTDNIPAPAITAAAATAARDGISLTVASATGANSYTLQRATNTAFTAGLTTIGTATTRTFTDTSANYGTTYYYRAKATNTSNTGESDWGAVRTVLIANICADRDYLGTYPNCGLKVKKLFSDGDYSQCALADDRGTSKLFCWGQSGADEWSENTPTAVDSSLFNNKTITDASFSDQICVVASGLLYCKGEITDANFSQVGGGLSGKTVTDVDVTGSTYYSSGAGITIDGRYQCAIASGELYCWGVNNYGQLGIGSRTATSTPTKVQGALAGKTVTSVSLALQSTCATASGQLYCWGMRLPDSTTAIYDMSPVLVGGLSGVTANAVDLQNNMACVSTVQLRAYCYGNGDTDSTGSGAYNRYASDGASRQSTAIATPVNIGSLPNNTTMSISGWAWNKCVLSTNNNVYCWGNNYNGDLGIGNNTNSNSAVQVSRLSNGLASKTITDYMGTCVIAADEMYCWGYGGLGRLATGNNSTSNVPVKSARFPAPAF